MHAQPDSSAADPPRLDVLTKLADIHAALLQCSVEIRALSCAIREQTAERHPPSDRPLPRYRDRRRRPA